MYPTSKIESSASTSLALNWNDHISRLPVELPMKALRDLDLIDLCSLACVSRHWNQVSSDDIMWKKIGLRVGYFGTEIKLKVLFTRKIAKVNLWELNGALRHLRSPQNIYNDLLQTQQQALITPPQLNQATPFRNFMQLSEELLVSQMTYPSVVSAVVHNRFFLAELHRDLKQIPLNLISELKSLYPSPESPVHPVDCDLIHVQTAIQYQSYTHETYHPYHYDLFPSPRLLRVGVVIPEQLYQHISHSLANQQHQKSLKILDIFFPRRLQVHFLCVLIKDALKTGLLPSLSISVNLMMPQHLPLINAAQAEWGLNKLAAFDLIVKILDQALDHDMNKAVKYFMDEIVPLLEKAKAQDGKDYTTFFLSKLELYFPSIIPQIKSRLTP